MKVVDFITWNSKLSSHPWRSFGISEHKTFKPARNPYWKTEFEFTQDTPNDAKRALPPVLHCLPWFVGLLIDFIFIVSGSEVGHYFKISFSNRLALQAFPTNIWFEVPLVRLW